MQAARAGLRDQKMLRSSCFFCSGRNDARMELRARLRNSEALKPSEFWAMRYSRTRLVRNMSIVGIESYQHSGIVELCRMLLDRRTQPVNTLLEMQTSTGICCSAR